MKISVPPPHGKILIIENEVFRVLCDWTHVQILLEGVRDFQILFFSKVFGYISNYPGYCV